MLRKSRTIAHLLRHLVFGVASVGAVTASAAVLAGCEDESQPDYWVKKLETPSKRAAAIKRLTQFYEDGLTKSNQNREAPEMKALLAKIVGPMTQAYMKGDLDDKTRIDLLKALANTRDLTAKEAIVKAITDFAAGKAHHEEMTQAAQYVKQLKIKEAAGPLLDAFLKIKVSDKELGPPYLPTKEAMVVIADPSWKAKLTELLNRPMANIDGKPDPKALAEAKNENYWQTVAAELLGDLKAEEAIKPLFKVVLTPEKKTVAGTAVSSLIKIGKPAVNPLLDVLTGKDADMAALAKKSGESNKFAHIQNAALVLGSIGRAEARDPMIAAINAAETDPVRAVLGREMSKLPTSPEAIRALEATFEKVAIDALIPPGDPARVVIAESAEKFMDASIVPWALKQVTALKTAKGEKEAIDAIQIALLQSAMKVMKKDQVDDVKKLVDLEGDDLTKAAFKLASDVTNNCGDNAGCYLAKLEDPAVQEKNGQFAGIKAAYMLGILGNDATKGEIVKRLGKIKNDGVRAAAINAIDHLSPNGDAKIAGELMQLVEAKEGRGDKGATDNFIKQVASRLRARTS